MLDDYASMARAALALFEATGERAYLDDAVALTREAQELFGDSDGSFFITARDAADVPGARPRHPHDGATPSGIGLIAEVLVRLFHLTGDDDWRGRGRKPHPRVHRNARPARAKPTAARRRRFPGARNCRRRRGSGRRSRRHRARAAGAFARPIPRPACCARRDGADWPEDSPGHGKTMQRRRARRLCLPGPHLQPAGDDDAGIAAAANS